MIDDKKSTDPGLSAAERKRMVREAAEGPMVAPTPELPDDTPIERVLFSSRIQNALRAADLKTVGEVREMSDETLISLPYFGKGSLAALRGKLGLPSTDGVRPVSKKPA
jgi:DNA-directed RNA polymerase alpha subunit